MSDFAAQIQSRAVRAAAPGRLWLRWLRPLGLLIVVLGLWQLGSAVLLDPASVTLLPPPSTIFKAFWELIQSGELWRHLRDSLRREFVAFAWSSLSIPLGLVMGYWRVVEEQFDPLVEVPCRFTLAWIPLSILWFGIWRHAERVHHLSRHVLPDPAQHHRRREEHRA